MNLYLLRHGQTVAATADPAQPLSRDGILRIQDCAAALRQLGLDFDLITCAAQRAAHQSAALVSEAVRYPYSDILETADLAADAGVDAALAFLRRQNRHRTVLLVGQPPLLAALAGRLLGSASLRLRCDPGSVCHLRSDDLADGSAELVFHLLPPHLSLLARR